MLLSLAACGTQAAETRAAEATEEPSETTETTDAAETSSYSATYDGTSGSASDYFTPVAESVESFEVKTVPCYVGDVENQSDISVGILNGMDDIAYLSLDTIAGLLQETYQTYLTDNTVEYTLDVGAVTDDGTCFALVRENDATMVVDFNSSKITVTDIDLFTSDPGAAGAMDVVSTTTNGGQTMITHNSMFYRNGGALIVDLAHYGIPTVLQDGEGYLPLQTVADLIYNRMGIYLLYNGAEVIVADSIEYPVVEDTLLEQALEAYEEGAGLTDESAAEETPAEEPAAEEVTAEPEETLSTLYYSGEKHERSEALRLFTYNELCLALDYNYGLQSEHSITSFNDLFLNSGMYEQLFSADAGDVYLALEDLCNNYFADSHSGVNTVSYMTELDPNTSPDVLNLMFGHNYDSYVAMAKYANARDEYYPDGAVGYEEVGDTAYITFDSFNFDSDRDYYNTEITNNMDDTFELILYANQQITRENSPVKNVVIDLSNNGGGYVDCAACVLSWMLSQATINLVDPITGAQSTTSYIFDTNLDGTPDQSMDMLRGVRKFCIISPNSFSCGNLVPFMLEYSDAVTLIGRSSNGGACVVENMTTADGNIFQISGPKRISTVTNGTYYSVDEGVDPDVYISDISHLYDRAYMTNLIDNLP